MTGGLSILDSLLDNLNELLKSKDGSILLLLSTGMVLYLTTTRVEDLLLKIYCQVVGRKGKIIEDDVADKLPKIRWGKDVKKSMDVIELSYKNLQHHLKPCLLYFGAFQEDQEIPVSKLTQLWMAEGFVRKTLGNNLETVAEDQLKDLIASSLVIVTKRRANGRVKSCRVHDLVRYFFLRKGNGENFLQLMRERDFYSLRHTEPHRLSMLLSSHSDDDLGFQIPRGLRGRSLICSSRMESYDWTDVFQQNPEFSWIPDRFKFLRVLDLEMVLVEGDSFFSKIGLLVHLRYLAAKLGGVSYSSKSFENLHNLEALKLKSKHSLYLPHLLQKLSRLRNLHTDKYYLYDSSSAELALCEGSTGFRHLVTFSAPVADNKLLEDTMRHFPRKDNFFPRCSSESTEIEASFKLENLQTFSSPLLVCNSVEESIMRGFSGLRMLSCEVLQGGYRSPRLDFLSQLESLGVSCSFTGREAPVNCEFNFPSCLKELTLCGFKLPWTEISRVARLPNLEDCELLKDVPSSFADICTLKAVKVDHCNLHVVNSVMRVKDDLLDLGYDGLDITILNSNFKPSSSRCWVDAGIANVLHYFNCSSEYIMHGKEQDNLNKITGRCKGVIIDAEMNQQMGDYGV
ncbi:hypothetical protein HAX54_021552 [Datura stramonium]|uniref:NB-ARC domain-containing protein n=1 Tax=Datura stramonium TaxID=4076 RepID=A0ABS8S6V5_DATST|nr:hypothetical protein [Datura stramonium]